MRAYHPKTPKEVGEINMIVSNKKNDRKKSKSKKIKKENLFITEYERMQLNTFRYQGYRYIRKMNNKAALIYTKEKAKLIPGGFNNLEKDKTYLIADIVANRIEVF